MVVLVQPVVASMLQYWVVVAAYGCLVFEVVRLAEVVLVDSWDRLLVLTFGVEAGCMRRVKVQMHRC
jgi:hypothetical protein